MPVSQVFAILLFFFLSCLKQICFFSCNHLNPAHLQVLLSSCHWSLLQETHLFAFGIVWISADTLSALCCDLLIVVHGNWVFIWALWVLSQLDCRCFQIGDHKILLHDSHHTWHNYSIANTHVLVGFLFLKHWTLRLFHLNYRPHHLGENFKIYIRFCITF